MPELDQLDGDLGVSPDPVVYEPPALVVLGTLAELTRGGDAWA